MALNKKIIAAIAGLPLVAAAMFAARFEGDVNTVYKDPVGRLAVCVGHDSYAPDGTPLRAGTTYTDDQCSDLLGKDIKTADDAVTRVVRVPLTEGERTAYTDFVFNVGAGAFARSTMARMLNAGNHKGACAQLLLWDKGTVNGRLVVLPGLATRRKAEYAQCITP